MGYTAEDLNLLWALTLNDFKLKYNRSVLGFFWSLLKPLAMLTTLYIVFHVLMRFRFPNYELFLLLGIILWNTFVEGTLYSMNNLLAKANLIKKVYLKRELIVLSSCLNAFITLFLNLIVFAVFGLLFHLDITKHALIFPVFLLLLFIFTYGIALGLSALFVLYRDITHIWEIVLTVGFWATPIIYPLGIIPLKYVKWYDLNPMARIINDSRDAILFNTIHSPWHLAITTIICLGVLVIGWAIFKKMSPRFAEEL